MNRKIKNKDEEVIIKLTDSNSKENENNKLLNLGSSSSPETEAINVTQTAEQPAAQQSKPHKKFTRSNYALLATHAINNIASLFVNTFLISYIYSISNNYILNIGLFYAVAYLVMAVAYYLLSNIIDRTNRIIIYKIAIIIRGAFMLSVVLAGKDLAQYVWLAGILYGFSEAFYWSSYNVMKNELVSSSLIGKYSTIQHTNEKLVNVFVPLILGKLIDAETFKISAIAVLCAVLLQLIISFFIKSNRPENSCFNYKEFICDIKNLGERNKPIKILFIATIFFGWITIISPLNTVLIMYSFNSNFSLGILTSIFSFLTIILLLIINKFTYSKKSKIFKILAAILCPAIAMLVIFYTTKETVIVYSLIYSVMSIVHSHFYDVYRNIVLKKYNLYRDIAEFQCTLEVIMELARTCAFLIMVILGLVGASLGEQGMLLIVKILLGVSIFSITFTNICLIKARKELKRCEIIE